MRLYVEQNKNKEIDPDIWKYLLFDDITYNGQIIQYSFLAKLNN